MRMVKITVPPAKGIADIMPGGDGAIYQGISFDIILPINMSDRNGFEAADVFLDLIINGFEMFLFDAILAVDLSNQKLAVGSVPSRSRAEHRQP